jgi:hypothetical protein
LAAGWLLAAGCWPLAVGRWLLAAGVWLLAIGWLAGCWLAAGWLPGSVQKAQFRGGWRSSVGLWALLYNPVWRILDTGCCIYVSRIQDAGYHAGYRIKSYSHSLVAPDKQGPADYW